MTTMAAFPAYGRDYKSKKAVMEDFLKGKDFKGYSMLLRIDTYFSIRDLDSLIEKGISSIEFRYNREMSVFIEKTSTIKAKVAEPFKKEA